MIRKIARKARIWAEEYARTHRFCRDLGGMCAIASAKLFRLLTDAGYDHVRIAVNGAHAFVICDEEIIDVTATQFGFDKIVITPLSKVGSSEYFWQAENTFKSVQAFAKYQNENDWSEDQIPTYRKLAYK